MERALDLIASDLEKAKRPPNTISSLVQLLKLERSLREEEELPQQIRVVWQETDADETDENENEQADSAENLPDG